MHRRRDPPMRSAALAMERALVQVAVAVARHVGEGADADARRGNKMRNFAISLMLIFMAHASSGLALHQKDFASPEAAVQALVAAATADDLQALLEVLGEQAEPALNGGDPVQRKNSRSKFLKAYAVAHSLDGDTNSRVTLNVGADKWPFPFPIIKQADRWRFDSASGIDELINRRVGANELATVQSCLAFVDAEREYYVRNPEGDALLHYAQKLISTQGRKDGLYWPTTGNEPISPLGEEFAHARSEGYFAQSAPKPAPYHGYLYHLLTSQGAHARGGAYDYMVRNKMLGGFALIASPAEYGTSGVMTFIVNHDGIVYSKDLGKDTPTAATSIQSFDPDDTWKEEAKIQ
jgi:hypothetical protein